MATANSFTSPATFCTNEGKRFWSIKGQYWWRSSKRFSTVAYKAILQDAFGSEESIETFSYDIPDEPCVPPAS